MVFSSLIFIIFFLPIFLIIYYLVPNKIKNIILLIFSLIFYAWGEPLYILLLLFIAFINYISGLLIDKAKIKRRKTLILILNIFINLAFLFYFKYIDFVLANLGLKTIGVVLPLGISFYIFQTMSYTIDLYRGEVGVQKNYFTLLTYVAMFPQLIAGPIVRYSDVEIELRERKITKQDVYDGFVTFLTGLFAKVLIANNVGYLFSLITEDISSISALTAWLGIGAYTLQIYFDFLGYSVMAIGLGKMLGFKYPANFNYPYVAESITDFWRRWHITLSTWFRDYVYIPLGGSRCGKKKLVRNILIVWMLTGFWHGASWNFIVWGLLFGVLLTIEKLVIGDKIEKIPKVIRHLYVLFVAMISFIIFNSNDIISAFHNISGLFGGGGEVFINDVCLYYLNSYGLILLMACFGATPICKNLVEKISKNKTGKKIINILEPVYLGVLLLIVTTYLIDGSYNPFLYFRF